MGLTGRNNVLHRITSGMGLNIDSVDERDVLTALSGLTGLGAVSALAGAPFGGIDETRLPRGPARRKAETILRGLDGITGVEIGDVEMQQRNWMLEFQMPDRDVHYPSALSLTRDSGQVAEMTLRLGPVGEREAVTDATERDLEADWVDVVLSAASETDTMDRLPESTRNTIDLGDAWISEYLRPHLRLPQRDDGYEITPRETVRLIEAIATRFDSKFGTFEDRQMNPAFAQNFERGARRE